LWCVNNNLDIVKILLIHDRLTTKDNNLLKISCYHYEIIQLLLKDGRLDPSYQNNDLIKKASKKGYVEIVKLLLNDSRIQQQIIIDIPKL